MPLAASRAQPQRESRAVRDTNPALLQVNSIRKTFRAKSGEVPALTAIDLEVREREFVSVIGPSGCGKSTLFKIIGGLESADAGEVCVDGRAIDGSHRDIGMVFQDESTFPWRTLIDNVAFPLEIAGLPRAARYEKAKRFVDLVGLAGFEKAYPAELSGGMRQRTAIARTLAAEPRILLMDEPFASLDEQTRMLLGEQLLEVCAALGQTTLLITHNISEAVQLSDRIVVMSFRPGTVKAIIDIDLPRPRTAEMIGTDAFARCVAQIWEHLRVEAKRGMQANIKEPANSKGGVKS